MDVSDRTLFQRMVTLAVLESRRSPPRPPTEALGLRREQLQRLIARHLPESSAALRRWLGALPAVVSTTTTPETTPETGPDALEEADLRAYLLEHRAGAAEEEEWLAAIVARRSLEPNHLWQDLGLADRGELNALFRRHFPSLVRSNRTDMKWKKFLYRQLCEREGIPVCKAPTCDACADHPLCFGPEAGEPLQALAALAPVRPNRAAATGRRQAQR